MAELDPDDPLQGRTARERARAREERDRRRAERVSSAPFDVEQDVQRLEPSTLAHAVRNLEEPAPARAPRRRLPEVSGEDPPRRPPRRPRRDGDRRRPGWLARSLLAVALVLAIALGWFLNALYQPLHGSAHGRVVVVIPAGSSAGGIGSILAHDHVISSSFFFRVRTFLDGKRGKLHSGTFVMQEGMSYSSAIGVLTGPPPAVRIVNVVVPEGESRVQIGHIAHADGLRGSYLAASLHSPLLNPATYGAPVSTPDLEGFLFPASYEMHSGASAAQLVDDQLGSFRLRLGSSFIAEARHVGMTPYQVLIIASMIEREASTAQDRPLVSSVIYNRLHRDMPLGIDSTLRYALDDWTQPLTEAQLQLNTPYNTRLHRGLPPTPIGNPGMASIDAALNPAHTNDLYYVVEPCGNGAMAFTSSFSRFEQDVAAYQSARAARGGNSPEKCAG
ncbi:MAG TPA: endolytic transglycosylase MltG [Solirubrobacteraceae bacterium]|jgi:uncharacterized YceG family protein|nr:endolytic transglycosylase MltG [Solirubrobacteraceae bacterium]